MAATEARGGRQRHLLTDTGGIVLEVLMTTAEVGDREGGAGCWVGSARPFLDRASPAGRGPFLAWPSG